MQKQLFNWRYLPLFCLFAAPVMAWGQNNPDTIQYGQTIRDTLETGASTITYKTPQAKAGDILFIRVASVLINSQFHLYDPVGNTIGIYAVQGVDNFVNLMYTVPPNGAGVYTIVVSDKTSFFHGPFCISLERMNASPAARFLPCDSTVPDTIQCWSDIQSFRYLVMKGARSKLTIASTLIGPEVWVCSEDGTILHHISKTLSQPVIIDTDPAADTACYYIFVVDSKGFFSGTFNISHSMITGSCAAASLQASPPNGEVCDGGGFTLNASSPLPNATYTWSGPNGFSASGPTITLSNISADSAGVYTVNVTNPGFCSSILSKTIVVLPLPTVNASVVPADGTVCVGQSVKLNATSNASFPTTYQWSKVDGTYMANGQSQTINTSANQDTAKAGTYVVRVTDGKGCQMTDSVDIFINPRPSVQIVAPPNNAVCQKAALSLFALTNVPAQTAVFSWSGPNNFTDTVQNPVIFNAQNENGGTYTVTVTNTVTGCTHSATTSISINPLPSASIGGILSICQFDSTVLTANGTTYTWKWSSGQTTKSIKVSPPANQTYTVTVTIPATGCTNTASATVVIKPLPTIGIELQSGPPDLELCEGVGNIVLCIKSDAESPGFTWTGPGLPSQQRCISFDKADQSGAWLAKVLDGNTQCANDTMVNIVIHPPLNLSMEQFPAGPHCHGTDLSLCASSNATMPTYHWDGPNGLSGSSDCLYLENVAMSQSGTYNVTVTDIHSCTASTGTIVLIDDSISVNAVVNGNQIQVSVNGGTPPFNYSILPAVIGSNDTGLFEGLLPGTYTVIVTDAIGCTASIPGVVVVTGVVEPLTEWGLSATPNPSKGLFEIRRNSPVTYPLQLDVFDQNGHKLQTCQLEAANQMLDLSTLPSGMYFLRVSDREKVGVLPLIRTH